MTIFTKERDFVYLYIKMLFHVSLVPDVYIFPDKNINRLEQNGPSGTSPNFKIIILSKLSYLVINPQIVRSVFINIQIWLEQLLEQDFVFVHK